MPGKSEKLLEEITQSSHDALEKPYDKKLAVKATITIFEALAKIGKGYPIQRIGKAVKSGQERAERDEQLRKEQGNS